MQGWMDFVYNPNKKPSLKVSHQAASSLNSWMNTHHCNTRVRGLSCQLSPNFVLNAKYPCEQKSIPGTNYTA